MFNLNSIEKLDSEQIKAVIEPQNMCYLGQLAIFDTIDSTNTFLLNQTQLKIPSGSVCFAEQQTQGRGRQGRTWFSPYGANIYCSIFWRFKMKPLTISGLSIAIAVILANSLKKFGIAAGVQLKWPNDVLFAGRKLAGILLECKHPSEVVIGFGLNLCLPPDADPTWITLEEITGRSIQRNYLAGLVLNEMLVNLTLYEVCGLNSFLLDWVKYDALINQAITVHTAKQIYTGVMKGINKQGELILEETNGNKLNFCYGEVSVRV